MMLRRWVALSLFLVAAHAMARPKRSVRVSAQHIAEVVDMGSTESPSGSTHFISVATSGEPEHNCFKFAPGVDLQEDLDGRMVFRNGGPSGVLQQKLHTSCDLGEDDIYETLSLVGMAATEHTPKSGDNANVPMVALSIHYTCRKLGVGQAGVILLEGPAADGCSGLSFTGAHDFRTTPRFKISFTLSGGPVPLRVSVVRLVDDTAGTDVTLHFVLYKGEGLVVYRDNHKTKTFQAIAAEVSAMAQSAVDFTTLRVPGTQIVCYFQGPSGFSRRYYEEETGFATAGALDEATLVSGTIAARDEKPTTAAQHAYWPEFDASGKWAQIRWIKDIAEASDLAALGSSAVPLGLLEKPSVVTASNDGIWAATSTQLLHLPHCDPAELTYEVYTDQGKFRYAYAIATDGEGSPVEVTAVVPSPQSTHVSVGVKISGEVHLVVVAVEQVECAATCEAWGMLQGSSPCDEALRPLSCTASVCALSTRHCCGKHCGSPLELHCAEGLFAHVRPGATSSTFCGMDSCDRPTYCCSDNCAAWECSGSSILKNNPAAIQCGPGCSSSDCCDVSTVKSCLAYVCPFGYTASGPNECGGDEGVCRTIDCCKKTCEGGLCPPGYVSKSPGTYPNDCCAPTCTFHQCSEGFASKAAATVCPSSLELCGDAVCCNVLCPGFTCPPGDVPLPNPADIACSSTPCDENDCCERRCSGFTCTGGYVRKADPESLTCTGACTQDFCCRTSCGLYTCGTGYTAKTAPAADTIPCTGDECTNLRCCDATCSLFNCPAKDVKKLNEGAIVCGATPSECDATECCDATCDYNLCDDPGFTPKTIPVGRIVCAFGSPVGGGPIGEETGGELEGLELTTGSLARRAGIVLSGSSLCTNEVCCNRLCSHEGLTCPANRPKKTARVVCVGAECTEDECCEAFCGPNFDCSETGYTKKANHATIKCIDSTDPDLSDPADCTKAVCCDVQCSHTSVECTPNRPKTTAMVVCGATEDTCTQDLCCEAFCGPNKDCSAFGFTKKANHATIKCIDSTDPALSDTADCTEAVCCDVLCSHEGIECPANRPKKATIVMCGATAGDCRNDDCCEAFCGPNNDCSASGFAKKDNHATIKCVDSTDPDLSDPADCTEAVCCDVLCSHVGIECPANRPKKTTMVVCGAIESECKNDECCEAFCGPNNDCSASGFTKKDNHATIKCIDSTDPDLSDPADCTEAVCCDVLCSNSGYSCPDSYVPKVGVDSIRCGARLSQCTEDICCDALVYCVSHSCSVGYLRRPASDGVVCGTDPLACSDSLCCDATCLTHAACPIHHLPKADPIQHNCGGSPCTDDFCCDLTCSSFTCVAPFAPKAAGVRCLEACDYDTCCDISCHLQPDKRWFRFAGRCRCLGCGPDGPKLCGKKGIERDSAFCQKYATDDTGEFRVATAARPVKEALNTACAHALVEAEPLAGGIWVDVLGVPYPMAWNVGPPPQCGAGRLTTKDTCKGPHCEWNENTALCVHSATFYRDEGCPTCRCYIPEGSDGLCRPQSGAFVVGRHCMCDEVQGFTCGASGQCMRS